jgi:hypothetical protein
MKPVPKPSSGKAMTHAERQARYRTKQAEGVPTLRYPADRRSRVQRWRDAVAGLQALQNDYQAWLEALPEALRAICDLDLSELQSIVPPKGLGRNRSVARCNL